MLGLDVIWTDIRLTFNPDGEDLSSFLARERPSRIQPGVSWIQVHRDRRPEQGNSTFDPDDFVSLWEPQIAAHKAAYKAAKKGQKDRDARPKLVRDFLAKLLRSAKDEGCTTGKWLFRVTAGDPRVDIVWAAIARAVVDGSLGCSAKVSPRDPPEATHVFCVYTDSFFDLADVARVMRKLKAIVPDFCISYKADVFTYLGWNVTMEDGSGNLRTVMGFDASFFVEADFDSGAKRTARRLNLQPLIEAVAAGAPPPLIMNLPSLAPTPTLTPAPSRTPALRSLLAPSATASVSPIAPARRTAAQTSATVSSSTAAPARRDSKVKSAVTSTVITSTARRGPYPEQRKTSSAEPIVVDSDSE